MYKPQDPEKHHILDRLSIELFVDNIETFMKDIDITLVKSMEIYEFDSSDGKYVTLKDKRDPNIKLQLSFCNLYYSMTITTWSNIYTNIIKSG